jgi:DNA-binding MarR family transcriptional regulator
MAIPANLLASPVLDADTGWAALTRGVLGFVDALRAACAAHGMTGAQFPFVLALLSGPAQTYASLGRVLGMTEAGARLGVARMERAGLVTVSTRRQDGTHEVRLALALRATVHRMQRTRRTASGWDAWWVTLSVPQRRALLNLLSAVGGPGQETDHDPIA